MLAVPMNALVHAVSDCFEGGHRFTFTLNCARGRRVLIHTLACHVLRELPVKVWSEPHASRTRDLQDSAAVATGPRYSIVTTGPLFPRDSRGAMWASALSLRSI